MISLYRIDVGPVVSNYIGETKKNLHRLFNEAEDLSAICSLMRRMRFAASGYTLELSALGSSPGDFQFARQKLCGQGFADATRAAEECTNGQYLFCLLREIDQRLFLEFG